MTDFMISGRATPVNMMKYKLSIQFYKYYNDLNQIDTWLDLYFQHNFKNRNKFVTINDSSRNKIGRNNLINRLNVINCKIEK